MPTNANADNGAVASALNGEIVRGERNLLAESAAPDLAGARAALETFYFAFNTRSADLYKRIWADDPLVQLISPIGGIVRGSADIAAFAERMLTGPARMRVQSVFEDIVAYETPELVVFAGRERGTYTHDAHDGEHEAMAERPEVRTTCLCIFRFIAGQGGWRQVYHQVALDDADHLAQFQRAARGG